MKVEANLECPFQANWKLALNSLHWLFVVSPWSRREVLSFLKNKIVEKTENSTKRHLMDELLKFLLGRIVIIIIIIIITTIIIIKRHLMDELLN